MEHLPGLAPEPAADSPNRDRSQRGRRRAAAAATTPADPAVDYDPSYLDTGDASDLDDAGFYDDTVPDGGYADPSEGYDPAEFDGVAFDAGIEFESDHYQPTFHRPAAEIIDELCQGLNPEQEQAVRALSGPVMVVAGPGSGKTRVLTHRIAALLASGAAPWEILAVTFTNKAAAEMRERIEALVGTGARDMWVATFHSACVRILRSNHEAAGMPRSFSIVDAADASKVLKDAAADIGIELDRTTLRDAAAAISNAKNERRSPDDVAAGNPRQRWVAELMQSYNDRLARLGACDFDDLLLRTLDLLENHPKIAARYQRRFRYVLVDEYQDTNRVQYLITRILAAGSGNLCVVGDTDQSIYSWRAASPESLLAFPRDYPHATVVVLEQNYRSTKAILEVVQAVIDPNPALHRPRLWTSNAQGDPVRLFVADDDRDEATWVVRQIRSSGHSPDTHAILVRTNAQTRSFEEELTRSSIPYQVVGALRFYDRAEIKDALAYLRCAINPADYISLARCINTPKRGLGDAAVAALLDIAADYDCDPIEAIRVGLRQELLPSRSRSGFTKFLDIYTAVAQACDEGPAAALGVVAEQGGLRQYLETSKDVIDRAENLDELISSAVRYVNGAAQTSPDARSVASMDGRTQTESFLEDVALVSSADAEAEPGAKVSILTAHASKGKEFRSVHVVGVEEDFFPHKRSQEDDAMLEEERRLLFVALSRAEEHLTISRCRRRMMYGGRFVENAPSRFLRDLPASVVRVPSTGGRSSGGWGGGNRQWGSSPAPKSANAAPRAARTVLEDPVTPITPRSPVVAGGPRLTVDQVTVGAVVRHRAFGDGAVTGIANGQVTVAFADKARTLDLTYAPLELVTP